MSDVSFRNIWISFVVFVPVAVVGFVLLRHDPTAKGFLGLAVIVSSCMLLNTLDERERRRKGIDRRRQQL